MGAECIDGKAIADARRQALREQVDALKAQGLQPCLVAVTVTVDPGWRVYQQHQERSCASCSISYRQEVLADGAGQQDLLECIETLNADPTVHGVIIQAPIPEPFDLVQAQGLLSPAKDVEGVNPANLGLLLAGRGGMAPCTARSAFALAQHHLGDLRGIEAVVIGASTIVGKPVAQLLLEAGATATVCHIDTRDVAAHARAADLLIVAVGKPGLLTADMVKPGATVIDVGINRVKGPDGKRRTVGDVADEVWEVAAAVTPVPGGVGSLTTCILLEQTVAAAQALATEQPAIEGAAIARILGPLGSDLPADVTDRIAGLLSRHMVAGSLAQTKSALQRRLERGQVIIMDGATGSELIARGVAPEAVAEANLAQPDLVQDVHAAYVDIGAEILVTNTFTLNRYTCDDREHCLQVIRSGVRLARQASRGRALVVGSLGPLPRIIGVEIDADEARDAYAELALAMADAGVDGFLCETLASTAEATAAVEGCRQASSLPVLVSRCYPGDDVGELKEFADAMAAAGADAIGLNCSGGPRALLPAVTLLASVSTLPVLARPNAGYPRLVDGVATYHLRPDWMAQHAEAYRLAGVRLIGGCCGVGAKHIEAVVARCGGQAVVEAAAQHDLQGELAAAPQAAIQVPGDGDFTTLALLSGRLSAIAARRAVSALAAAGIHGFGLDYGWPGSGTLSTLPSRLRHLQDSADCPAVLALPVGRLAVRDVQSMLWSAHLLGVRTVLIDGGIFSDGAVGDQAMCPQSMVRLVAAANAGRNAFGNRLPEATAFAIGVRLPVDDTAKAASYAEAGAHFITIQPVYEAERWRRAMREYNCALPLLAEVLVLPDVETADELDNEVPALSVPQALKDRLGLDPAEDTRAVGRFLSAWRARLAGVCLLLPDARSDAATAVIADLAVQSQAGR